jgi:hypothetical protein
MGNPTVMFQRLSAEKKLVWGTGLARFERATYRLGGGRSILLSYSPRA